MNLLKTAAPVALLGVVCLPCLALAVGVTGGALSAIGGALLTPTVGIPLVGAGLALVAAGVVLWRRRRACALPSSVAPDGAARTSAREAARAARPLRD